MFCMKLRLKYLRKQRSLTIDKLAEMSGLTRGFISLLENDKREASAETLRQLAAALQVEPRDIIDAGPESARLDALLLDAQGLSESDILTLRLMAQTLRARSLP